MKLGLVYIPLVLIAMAGVGAVMWRVGGGGGSGEGAAGVDLRRAGSEPTVRVVKEKAEIQPAPGQPLANLDRRGEGMAASVGSVSPGKVRALAKLRQKVPDVAVEFDRISGGAKWVGSPSALLTGPRAGATADEAVRQFVEANRDLFGHGGGVLDGARKVVDDASKRGSRKVVWHQQLDGIDIFEAIFQANLTAEGALINAGSQMIPDPETAAGDRAGLLAAVPVAAERAVAVAGADVGEKVSARTVRAAGPPAAQPDRRQTFRAAMLTDAEAKLVWVPMNATSLRLAWDVTVASRTKAEMYRVLVDARTAEVLVRHSLTAYLGEASYRVFTAESPTPMSPGHEAPSSLQPLPVSRVMVTTAALNPIASPNGWISEGGNTTSGNNTDTYADSNGDNAADQPRVLGAPNRVFDFPADLTQAPATYRSAAITQLFYWTNLAHDRLYDLGFTEAAGNFQVDNFGRGGAGNDPVNAEAQDGAGTNNANFSTPVDGGRGRMQMFLWTDPAPERDGAFEAEIVLHEYCHGLSNRLVGGPSVTISALVTQGLGEGWSDFYSLALTAEASDNPHANWARAGYTRYQASGWLSENYYFGTRRYSYSTDLLKNPHTFKDIDPGKVDWHVNVPRNPTFAATQDTTQVHYQGTVWCAMLWELRANLILKHGFGIGNERTMFLVTEGMKFSPANPNFVQARDGILQATLVNHPGDLGEVWTAFAKRGLGQGAKAPASSTTTGVVESYLVPDSLEISDRGGWTIAGTAGGAFTPAAKTITVSNDGTGPVNWTVDTKAAWLSASPAGGTLAPGGSTVVTFTTHAESISAGFHSTNVVFGNVGTGFQQPIGVRLQVAPPGVLSFPLDADPGWTRTGEWAFGVPLGLGGGGSSGPDPKSGATGSQVFGVNLAGNPSTGLTGTHYLTLGPVDLSGLKKTRLRFMRWLNANALANTRVTVEVSNDGALWREVFVNPGTPVTDKAWRQMDYDISSIADGEGQVQVRWGYRNISAPGTYSGWNIDDVEILGESTAKLAVEVPASVPEGGGPVTGVVTLGQAQLTPITVTLTSSDSTAATVPELIEFAAGETSKTFPVNPVNDADLDGTQPVTITVSAPDMIPCTATVAVTDDENAVLTLEAPASVTEGAADIPASVSVSQPPTRDLTVTLSSNHGALAPPASVVIPAGSAEPIHFTCEAPNNGLVDGVRQVVLTAAVSDWPAASRQLVVTDDDVPALSLAGPANLREGDGAKAMTVTVNALATTSLVVKLASSDTSEVTVPASVTIPAGQWSAVFNATVVNDTLADGGQSANLTASVANYASAGFALSIADNEVNHYTFEFILSPQRIKKAIPVTITARDIGGAPVTNHAGTVKLTGTAPFTQTPLSAFSAGVSRGTITVSASTNGMKLTATDTRGNSGVSNAFDVAPGVHQSFVWSGLPTGTVAPETLFNAKVAAVDDGGIPAANYTSPTEIEAYVPVPDCLVGAADSTLTTTKVYNTTAHDSRVQLIYTVAELGSEPRWIGALQTSLAATGGQPMKAFNIRLKHTALESFDGQGWEGAGWTVVHTTASAAAGSTWFVLSKPFYYDGAQNLMVDISFNNTTATSSGALRCLTTSTKRMLSGVSNSTHGDPLTWAGAVGPAPVLSNELPTLQFYVVRSLGPIPASPVVFSAGTWSGTTFAPAMGCQAVWLLATAPSGIFAFSPRVLLTNPSAAPAASTGMVFSDGFESGALGPAWSTAGSSGITARTAITTASVPKGKYHLTMDTTSPAAGPYARNSLTLTVDLAGKSNVMLDWRAKAFSDEGHAPVLEGPLGSFDSEADFDGVAVSGDGVTWVEVAPLRGLPSAYPAAASRVFLDPIVQRMGWAYHNHFQIRFSHYGNQAMANDGVAIDDVAVRANPATAVALGLPPNISEGALNQPVAVTLPAVRTTATTVKLVSNAPARLTISASVTIPAGQLTGSAVLSAPQNHYADVGKDVVITASATGLTTAVFHTRVVDDERPVLSVSLPPAVLAGESPVTGVVTMTPMAACAVPVYLSSSDNGRVVVSEVVTIPFGAESAAFAVMPVRDAPATESQAVVVTAKAQGALEGAAVVEVVDSAEVAAEP